MKSTNVHEHADKYIVYARKSTDDADNQKNSLDFQVGEDSRYCKRETIKIAPVTIDGYMVNGVIQERHTAYKMADMEIADDGRISFDIARPKFQRLIADLKNGVYKGVVALCWDRLSRNDQDHMVIKRLMDDFGVDVRFVQTKYEKTASGALHRDIDGMFSSHYSREVSQKTRNALEKLRDAGKCTYVAPLGYLDHGSDNKVPDPERAPLVVRIFELCSTGEWSYRQLAHWGNGQGLTTKPMRPRRSREDILNGVENAGPKVSRPLTGKSIENMLHNPFYIGKMLYRGTWIQGTHIPLIDAGLFYKVQNVLKVRTKSVHHPNKDFFTYRGFIRCGCGRSYSPYEQKNDKYYRAKCKEGCANSDPNLTDDKINAFIGGLLGRVAFTDEEVDDIERRASLGLNKAATERERKLADLEASRRRVYADMDYLKLDKVTLLRTKAMSPEEFTERLTKLECELVEIKKGFDAIEEDEHKMLRYVLTFSELVKNAAIYYGHALDIERHEIITEVFSELTFFNGEFSFVAKDGFSALFSRHEQKKTHHDEHDVVSGSGGGC